MAVGTSFGEHVMAGYKYVTSRHILPSFAVTFGLPRRFLMRCYNPGDAIYFFGFSRGAYTARFLAQMLGQCLFNVECLCHT